MFAESLRLFEELGSPDADTARRSLERVQATVAREPQPNDSGTD